jgi:arylsulfatase A-like enzyme
VTEKPNIVFIVTDNIGYGITSSYNGFLGTTPRIDKRSSVLTARSHGIFVVERPGLTPSWTRSEPDALLSEYSGDGRVGDAKASAEPRE